MNIARILAAHGVTRWHAKPGIPAEPLGHHHACVATLCDWLADGASAELLRAALWHDAHEILTGDAPADAKRRYPALRAAYEAAAAEANAELRIPECQLDRREAAILALADRLAAILYVAAYAPHLMQTGEWIAERTMATQAAWGIGQDVAAKVMGVMK